MTNPLQEKILKEFRERIEPWYDRRKDYEGYDMDGDMLAMQHREETVEAWLTTTLEEVYKAGEEDGERLQKMWNDMNNAKTY